MKSTISKFHNHFFAADVSGQTINFRVLKMEDSLFIYIGTKDSETFDEIGLAMLLPGKKEAISTSVVGSTESRDIAQKLSLRLNKPVFISCNANVDRITGPLIEKMLLQEITERPEFF
jgi:hypothetical protein